jgi:hypothetical protein
VGAVTGASREDVEKAILAAAAEDGEHPAHLADTNFRHQARAVELSGFELFESDGVTRVDARIIEAYPQVDLHWLSKRPTAAGFLQDNVSHHPLLCFACRVPPVLGDNYHTFAVHCGFYYDNNTEQKVKTSVPATELANFRVFRALAVRRRLTGSSGSTNPKGGPGGAS